MNLIDLLKPLRNSGGRVLTRGLDDATIARFAATDARLGEAVKAASEAFEALREEAPALVAMDEAEQIRAVQAGYVNFYQDDAVNPYLGLAAVGPWIVTTKGAVVHDSGGYGMLGLGHAPKRVLDAMAKPYVMANIMSPSVSQWRLAEALKREVGQTRGGCPFTKFLCLNSGSEAVTLAGRIADVHTRLMTDPGGPHAGWRVKRIAIKGAFHGRTELPAMYSDSSRRAYAQYLGSWKHHEGQLITIEPYDIDQLREVFAQAEREHWHIEAMFLEPVMGEGNPGRAVPPAFYAAARELTLSHGTLLLVDSIQAGIRTTGYLSIVDAPGFEHLDAPDFETWSKAINAGQYPLSILAVNARAEALYRKGVYGNTMTTNPRALEVARAVLESLTPELRRNIVERGREFVEKLEALAKELPGTITKVQGTGLLISAELSPEFKCYGENSTEDWMRRRGYGVIHGGTNALRFTPPFDVTSAEIDLIVEGVRQALREGPRVTLAEAPRAAA
jgi:4-aminobutyrate aminotransferase-like enzyme